MSDPLIFPRSFWGAAAPKPGIPTMAYPVDEVFIHHEGGMVWSSVDIDAERAKMRSLQADTMARGYNDFPYGVAVFPSGRAYEGRDLGFVGGGLLLEEGATINHNSHSIAVVLIGNYDLQRVSPQALSTMANVIKLAQFVGRVRLDVQIRPHSDVFGTACPGANGRAAMPSLRALVARAAPPAPAPIPPKPKVVPMHNPPWVLPPIVADCDCPTGGAWQLGTNGDVITVGTAPGHGSPKQTGVKLSPGETWAQIRPWQHGDAQVKNAQGVYGDGHFVCITSAGDKYAF